MADIARQIIFQGAKIVDIQEPTKHESNRCENIKQDWRFFECERCLDPTPPMKEFCEQICQKEKNKFIACALQYEMYKIMTQNN